MLKLIGGLLIAVGVISAGYALGMEVTVGYTDRVYNSGLMATREVYTIAGSAIAIIGTLIAMSGVIVELIEKKENEKLDILKNISNGLADHLEK
ncbi:hypothetical protein V3510_001425 [Serratia marcescens]|uniref:hypothetical protein n=1 Tax=Serratia TaxID=613 RepID=UPI000D953F32|nr:hypothetical protein [Serratia marcescens]EME1466148.1 hypothetical protein [Serratia marcescens]PYA07265.1 hypothetical protein DMW43_07950 [Serratia marcescens]HEI9781149.1 hypothetical protein [Serratia marcescens]